MKKNNSESWAVVHYNTIGSATRGFRAHGALRTNSMRRTFTQVPERKGAREASIVVAFNSVLVRNEFSTQTEAELEEPLEAAFDVGVLGEVEAGAFAAFGQADLRLDGPRGDGLTSQELVEPPGQLGPPAARRTRARRCCRGTFFNFKTLTVQCGFARKKWDSELLIN